MQGIKKKGRCASQHLAHPLRPYMCHVKGDLQQEISYLKSMVFPHLDSLCLSRGTCFRPLDLHQNKGEDEDDEHPIHQTTLKTPSLHDQRVKISLDLIDRSAFFICLLGRTYGDFLQGEKGSTFDIGPGSSSEVARNLHVAAMAGYPWVMEDEYRTCGLTELEIIKATFRDEHKMCFFYFKDFTPQDNMDGIGDETLMSLSELYAENRGVRHRMRNLKRRIIGRCLPVRFFRNLHELGMMIKKDWEEVMNQLYGDPEYSITGRQDLLDICYHESHGCALSRQFVPSPQATKILNTFNTFVHPIILGTKSEIRSEAHFKCSLDGKESEKSVLLVCGERGCGKSTLAACWLQAFCRQNSDVPVISHFCGTSTSSTDVRSILRQWTAELRRVHDDWVENLEDASEIEPLHRMVQAFSAAVNLGPCVLLLDGIDLLAETFGLSVQEVKELRWLPDALPHHCKLIITTTFTDLTYKSLTARTDVLPLTCLDLSDPGVHRSILLKHLSIPCKDLPTKVFQRIVAKKLCHKPVFLAVLGTEMRSCGVQRDKEEEIELLEEYIDVDSVPELWVKVILRWVKDYNGSTPTETISSCHEEQNTTSTTPFTENMSGWVWDTLCLIHLSHAGLTENEILALLEYLGYCGNLKVQMLEWARLRSAIWPWVQEKANGHLTIMHQSFSQAMNLLLLDSRGQIKRENDFHQVLADFFQMSGLQLCSWVRKIEEIPWHLMKMSSLRELHNFLTDRMTVEALSSSMEKYPQLTIDVVHYWALLRERGYDPASSFQNLMIQACRMEDLDEGSRWRTSLFCSKVLLCFGETQQAEQMLLKADRIFQKDKELDRDTFRILLKVQHTLTNLYEQMHRLRDAEIYCHKGFETAKNLTDSTDVQLIVGQLLCRLCLILLKDGRLYAVPGLLKEIGSDSYKSAYACFKGSVLVLKAIHKLSLNEPKGAERCFQDALTVRRRWYGSDHPLVAEVEEHLADLWSDTQSNTEWEQRKTVELYRHVLSITETEAQALQLVDLQHDLALILVKFGKYLLRHKSKAESKEGLDLLQRASDIKIGILGHEHLTNTDVVPLRKLVPGVSRQGSNRKLSMSPAGSPQHPNTGLQQTTPKSYMTRSTLRIGSLSEGRPASENPSCSLDETPKRPWTTFQVSVFGPQSDIKTLLPLGLAGWRSLSDRKL